ncbi:glutamic acid-rich protein-like [Dendronephthya gigantea]|uniref:glutamic acid-rich protein-like n=1 Tax=Dendronephthya gigantea TaxID=151771 RepID=UPI00106A5521|nr:glutamic acid-rich protein-like [Dendronephthya gigantea]
MVKIRNPTCEEHRSLVFLRSKILRNTRLQRKRSPPDEPTRSVSKKDKKREEKRSKKEQKEREKELKQLEKEKRKSLKSSGKDVVGSVDTSVPHDAVKTNGDLKTGLDVGKASNEPQARSLAVDGDIKNDSEAPLEQNVESSEGHEKVSSEFNLSISTNEASARENVELIGNATSGVEHETSIKSRGITNDGHDVEQSELSFGNGAVIEETIKPEDAESTEEAPPDSFSQPVVCPAFPEPTGGQHVEIEISEVGELDVDPSSSDEVVVSPQDPFHGHPGEGEIVVSTVQIVESSVDVDSFFAEDYGPLEQVEKEEARKSVRFQDETEEIGCSDGDTEDHEHASLNLGGDFTETDDDDQKRKLEPAVEIVRKEERQTVESCVDLDNVFAPSKRQSDDTEAVPSKAEGNHAGSKVNGSAKVNGKAAGNGRTNMGRFEEIDLNGSNEQKNTTVAKKEKRKRSRLMRCCFP